MATLPGALAGTRIVGERFVHSRRPPNPDGRMPLMDHIRELRNRVVKMALALAAGMTAGFIFFGQVWHVIERPLCAATIRGSSGCHTLGVNELVLNGPLDAFYLRVKVALIAGVILSSPVWLYQIWAFITPGLHAREKRWSYLFLGAAIPLFGIGITLCYLSLGRSLRYLLGLTPGGVQNLIQVDQYLSFVMAMMLAFGLAFEIPLLIVMLNLAGILTHARFRKWRRVLIFAVFLIAGAANPSPDPVTMLILGGTCAVLVEAAEVIVWSHDRRRARLHPDPYAGLADDELSPLPSAGPGRSLAVFDLSLPKLLVLAVIALIIFGPKELPQIASQAGRVLRDLRKIAEAARNDLREGLGPEFADFEIEDLNPKRFVQKHISGDPNADQAARQQPPRQAAANGTPLTPGQRPPSDPSTT